MSKRALTLNFGLPAPRLGWSDVGVPRNLDHDDGYFSDGDGLAESRAVFLAGCHLPKAWETRKQFTIGELGFGTGLNFLNTWDLWRRTRSSGARLHFVSVEGAPFDQNQLQRAHKAFPVLKNLSQKLRTQWSSAIKGVHRLFFDGDGVTLTLYFMGVDEALPQMEMSAHAWFLDGFAPSRNAAMWSADVFSHLARLSHNGTRLATFSVAGSVRRGLTEAGFLVSKEPGFGRKRERLEAVYKGPELTSLRRQSRPHAYAKPASKPILVLGGGIAGASVVHGFLRRGLKVTQISKAGLGDEASGNPAALVSPRLDLEDAPPARFFRTAFHHAVATYAALGPGIWNPCGLVRLPAHASDHQKFTRLVKARALPGNEMFITKDGAGLQMPCAGVVVPDKAIAAMTKGATQIEVPVTSLERKDGLWVAFDEKQNPIASASMAVMALGSGGLQQTGGLDFRYLKGQITIADISPPYDGPAVLADGYALGLAGGHLLTGATYEPIEKMDDVDLRSQAKDHASNINALSEFAPDLANRIDMSSLSGRVSIRAATPDQMPYVGAMVDPHDFQARFHALQHGFLDPKAGRASLQENLFVLMGLGSRGFALAPILGEAITAEVLGEPSPLERSVAESLHPARVLERKLRKPV